MAKFRTGDVGEYIDEKTKEVSRWEIVAVFRDKCKCKKLVAELISGNKFGAMCIFKESEIQNENI